jgi:AAHS family 4-hydroxybenzoate transporter-like MFS transporter
MDDTRRTIDIAGMVEGRKLGRFNYALIMVSWLVTVFDGFDMMMIGFTAPYMRDDLGLDEMMLGNVFSAGLLGMMLGGFAFAWVGDWVGRRRAIIWAAFAFGILTFATGFAESYPALLVLRFLDGFAIGGMLPLIWALNIEYVPRRMRSTVVTIIMMGYSIGSALAGPVTNWLAPGNGWESVFFFGGAATIAIAVLLIFTLPESVRFLAAKDIRPDIVAATLNRLDPAIAASPQDRFIVADEQRDPGNFTVGKLFRGDLRWLTPLLWLGYTASTLAVYFTANWGPIIFEDLAYSRETAAYVGSLTGVLGAALGLALMQFTDRRGPFSLAVYPLIAFAGHLPATGDRGDQPRGRRAFRHSVDRRGLLPQRHPRQWRRLGHVGGQDRRDCRADPWRAGAGQRAADRAQLCAAGAVPGDTGGLRDRHRHDYPPPPGRTACRATCPDTRRTLCATCDFLLMKGPAR